MTPEQRDGLKNMVLKNLENITKSSKELAKIFKSHSITPVAFRGICDELKAKDDQSKPNLFLESYNKMIDLVYETCNEMMVKMDSRTIPVEYIRTVVQTTKINFAQSFDLGADSPKEVLNEMESPVKPIEDDNSGVGKQ